MTELSEREASLEPLRAALIARANDDAGHGRAGAEASEREAVAGAHEQAAALLAAARVQGERDAAALHVIELARTRRRAREVVLHAQRDAYEELRERAEEAVRELLRDPIWHQQLITVLRRQLGEQAELCEQPDGGVIAQEPDGRSIDTSVVALADQAVAALDLDRLWTPG
jgi:hypothetical protein